MAVGVNAVVFIMGFAMNSTDLSLLGLGSGACCLIGIYTTKESD
tara:strand:+ start:3265 stop:3396 length:132 start_codon:yes stop_codon:yes gene_type:complete